MVVERLDAIGLDQARGWMLGGEAQDEHGHGFVEAMMVQSDLLEDLGGAIAFAEEVGDRDVMLDEHRRDHEAHRRGEGAIPRCPLLQR